MAGPSLMSVPLEIRHQIFEHVSAGNEAPKKVLRRWFEKKEVKALIAQAQANDPTRPSPVASYDTRDPYEEDTDEEEASAEEDNEAENENEDSEDEQQDDDSGDEPDEDGDDDEPEVEQDSEEEDVNEDEDEVMDELDDNALHEGEEAEDDGGAMDGVEGTQQHTTVQTATNGPATEGETDDSSDTHVADSMPTVQGQIGSASDNVPHDDDIGLTGVDNGNTNSTESQNEDDLPSDQEEEVIADASTIAVDNDNTTAGAPPPPPPPPPAPPARVIRPHHKWRHIPKFLRISQSPPPGELFLTCKELNREAKDWFYDTAVIRIDATGSFQHFTMFEHSLDQIVDAVFSPFENVRKVEVKFVWDTEWIRAHGKGFDDLFATILYMRADHVIKVLRRAPELKEVAIKWHDSINDDLSAVLKHNIFEKFTDLAEEMLMQEKYITVNTDEYYLEAGKKPHRKSTLGRKRIEFQNFADAQFEFK